MITLLKKLFSRKLRDADPAQKRVLCGTLCSVTGIFLNVCLFIGKYVAGAVSGSVAVMADAFNNLSDAGSSGITLLGFRLAERKPDQRHPFGHGRLEYLSGFLVSAAIVAVGVELARASFEKIITPQPVETSGLTVGILIASILVKGYMFFYNYREGKRLHSAGMKATAADSISDAVATSAVLVATLIQKFTGLSVDGWCGCLVALFILYTGVTSAMDTIQPLLGQMPDPELVRAIRERALSYEEIYGIHDLVIHDYGPGRCMVSLHAEVDGNGNVFVLHDAIDRLERQLNQELRCEAVIHMDPIVTGDEHTRAMREQVEHALWQIYPKVSIHDFRMVVGPTHTNVIFDMVVPYDSKEDDDTLAQKAAAQIHACSPDLYAVIQVDHAYTAQEETTEGWTKETVAR